MGRGIFTKEHYDIFLFSMPTSIIFPDTPLTCDPSGQTTASLCPRPRSPRDIEAVEESRVSTRPAVCISSLPAPSINTTKAIILQLSIKPHNLSSENYQTSYHKPINCIRSFYVMVMRI